MQKVSVLKALCQGISFNKEKAKKRTQARTEKFTIEEGEALLEEDEDLLCGALKHIDTIDKLNNAEFRQQRPERERKAINRYRDKVSKLLKTTKMKLTGADIPVPSLDFSHIVKRGETPSELVEALFKMGCKKPTPIQAQSIPVILNGRNCIAIAPTGSGKTIAYTLPTLSNIYKAKKDGILEKGVIIAPTFELSLQIYKTVLAFIGKEGAIGGLRGGHIYKLDFTSKETLKTSIDGLDILVTTPMKFIQLAEAEIDLSPFKHVVLDEADKYFEMSFMKQFNSILDSLKGGERNYYLFSATFPPEIENRLKDIFVDPVEIVIRGKMTVLNTINQELTFTGNEYGKILGLKSIINEGRLDIPCLIFVESKERVQELHSHMSKWGIPVAQIRSNMGKEYREQMIDEFTSEKKWILITTDLLARGIDFPKVKLVINFDIPESMVTYVHRVGRSGRAGYVGRAITFFTSEDKVTVRLLADLLKSSECAVPEWIFKIKKPSKKEILNLRKRAPQRESISSDPYKHKDFSFGRKIKKMDGEYLEKLKLAEQGVVEKGEKNPQMYLAKQIKEMLGGKSRVDDGDDDDDQDDLEDAADGDEQDDE